VIHPTRAEEVLWVTCANCGVSTTHQLTRIGYTMRSSVWMSNQPILSEFTALILIVVFTLPVGLRSYL
jgi:hypothetical protein